MLFCLLKKLLCICHIVRCLPLSVQHKHAVTEMCAAGGGGVLMVLCAIQKLLLIALWPPGHPAC
jgi:hypothetical protein